jgi:molecular chaperone GrpE
VEEATVKNKEEVRTDNASSEAAAVEEPQPEALEQLREVLTAERDGFKAERDELKELLLRRQAEFDNFRKRTEKERSEYVQYAGMEIVREILPILDDFDRARKVEGGSPEYTKGVEMIYSRMVETLKKQGLEPIETAEQSFDPHLHQAVERVETKDSADGTILGEFQRGYNFKGKLLRPSMVKVAVRS